MMAPLGIEGELHDMVMDSPTSMTGRLNPCGTEREREIMEREREKFKLKSTS